MYNYILSEQLDLLEALKEFKERFRIDNDLLEIRQIHDRVRFVKNPPLSWQMQPQSLPKRIMLQDEYYKTYDDRFISVNDVNMLYI